MMVNGGVVVNPTPYSMFKKLQLDEADLREINMALRAFEGREEVEAKCMISFDLSFETKTLATAFFLDYMDCEGKIPTAIYFKR
jgi:hypothetical protein